MGFRMGGLSWCPRRATWMRGAFAAQLGFWLAVADRCEVLAALDGGVPSCRISTRWLLDIFHLHFFMMYPKIRGPEVLLAALPLSNTVGGPLPMEQKLEGECECVYSMVFPLISRSIQVRSREGYKSVPRRKPMKSKNWQACLGCLSSSPLELHHIMGAVVLNPQGLGCLPESAWLQLHQLQILTQGDNGLDEARCQSSELVIRYLTETSV